MIERFAQMPSALRANARWLRLGVSGVPSLVVHPDWNSGNAVPVVLWLHGRTANKELDPGRYLRWMRAGIGVCAVDLPGHGERMSKEMQTAEYTPHILAQAIDEIDIVIEALGELEGFDLERMGIGGMSAGGMAVLARLCREHPFRSASVEATTGAWGEHFGERAATNEFLRTNDPIEHLASWREIPLQAFHSRGDELVSHRSQEKFIDELRRHYHQADLIEFVEYDHTGAPSEHLGFGRMSADAKERQRDFFVRTLKP